MMRLGKRAARQDAIRLKLARYLLPVRPAVPPGPFGRAGLISDWGMLGNDQYGCCVFAGADHETMLLNKVAGRNVTFAVQDTLSDYSAVTGFNPADPNSDQGTDMQVAADYRLKTGLLSADGERHKVAAYVQPAVGNFEELIEGLYLFQVVGVGVLLPDSAMRQFDAGHPWFPVDGAKILGGHYVPAIDRAANGNLVVVTWGREQEITPDFYAQYNDESVVYLSEEMLRDGKSPEGFDLETLKSDLALVTG